MASSSPLGGALLPVVQVVAWQGWSEDQEAEADIWVEARAMARLGWSETRWRLWLQELKAEAARRTEDLEEMYKLWEKWGSDGDKTPCQERAWDAMLVVELERRVAWGLRMRRGGYGEECGVWVGRLREIGVWQMWMQELMEIGEEIGEEPREEDEEEMEDE